MKYTITINQVGVAAAGLDEHTDMIDWAILEYIRDWSLNPKARKIGAAVWINYQHLIANMPLLGLKTKGAVSKRIAKLIDLDLLTAEKDSDRHVYVEMTAKYHRTVSFRGVSETDEVFPAGNGGVSCGKQGVSCGKRISKSVVGNQDEVARANRSDDRPAVTVAWVASEYKKRFPHALQIEKMTEARRKNCQARIRNDLKTTEDWERYFDAIEASDFLMGRAQPGPGRDKPFRLSFDFIVRESACVAIMEGKYDN